MAPPCANPVVHMELHAGNREDACSYYTGLFGWRADLIQPRGCGSYLAFDPGGAIGGGVVECGTSRALWLPYVQVSDLDETIARARGLGASVMLEPREGPAGRRSVLASAEAGEIAIWQPRP